MQVMNLRWFICLMVMLLAGMAFAVPEEMEPLADAELESVCAAGLNIQVDLDVGLATNHPDLMLINTNRLDSLRAIAEANQQQSSSMSGGGLVGDILDGVMDTIQNTINSSISISDNALQNAQSLLNIIALGDVAVGINITVIVNPTNSPFDVTQTNINWSDLIPISTPIVP